jgi:hypothetical protein
MMHFIYGLIDPRTMRVFHVGCALNPTIQLDTLPTAVASRVAEMAPATPHVVILQTVDAHPQVAWAKWCKRFRRDILTSDWQRYEGIADAFSNSNRVKRVMGEEVPSDREHQEKFHDFDRQNPQVFEEMLRGARQFRAEGRSISGIEVLANQIRYEPVETNHTDPYKLNNNFKAFYARKLQMVDPSLCGLFGMRESAADDLILEDGRTWRDFAREYSDSLRYAGPEGTEEDMRWTY